MLLRDSPAPSASTLLLRVIPFDECYWFGDDPQGFDGSLPQYIQRTASVLNGKRFFTIGAGPGVRGVGPLFAPLEADFNRPRDITEPKRDIEDAMPSVSVLWALGYRQLAAGLENDVIRKLIGATSAFPDRMYQYDLFPAEPMAYNSNSFLIGLVNMFPELQAPSFRTRQMIGLDVDPGGGIHETGPYDVYAGWRKPVPPWPWTPY